MKKKVVLLIAVCTIILCVFLLSKQPFSSSTDSVKEFISVRNGDLGIERIIALTEVSSEYDLVFYYTSDNQIAANILIKNEEGKYVGFEMTSHQSLDHVNHVIGSTLQSFSENTLYWGIAQSPEWTIDHPLSHSIVVDELALGYYFHDKSLDEETVDLNFVYSGS